MDFIQKRSHNLSPTKSGSSVALYLCIALLLVLLPRLTYALRAAGEDGGIKPTLRSYDERRAWLYGEKMNINHANAASLMRISGIGPSLAQKIGDHKKKHGPFKRWSELLNVKGIGPKTLLKLEPYLEAKVAEFN